MSANLLQLKKAYDPILLILFGISILFIFINCENASFPIFVIPSSIFTDSMLCSSP